MKKRKKANLEKRINKAVKKQIAALLNPDVEIVSNDIPVYASESSAGADIKADLWEIKENFLVNAEVLYGELEDSTLKPIKGIVVHPGGQCLVPTGIYTYFPSLYRAEIVPRSGNALKYRITITNSPGTIEGDYKNEWGIIIANEGSEDFVIHQGDRIAQVIFSLVVRPNFIVKETAGDLSGSDRGGGFGHSGK